MDNPILTALGVLLVSTSSMLLAYALNERVKRPLPVIIALLVVGVWAVFGG